jgi:hypothetical protein
MATARSQTSSNTAMSVSSSEDARMTRHDSALPLISSGSRPTWSSAMNILTGTFSVTRACSPAAISARSAAGRPGMANPAG